MKGFHGGSFLLVSLAVSLKVKVSLWMGAILQVIYVIAKMLIEDHRTHKEPSVSWLNLSGFAIGLLIMYFTAFFVKF
ncbi:hypothetical protein J2S09_000189 [Bacillus fengqiuensis]|nr:hypothetical protein [Bacillus fengqiuensis]